MKKFLKMTSNRSEGGQSLVEYALILPIFLIFALFITDLGRAAYSYSVVYNAAREGARYGSINPDDFTGIQNRAKHLTSGLDQSNLFVSSATYSDTVQVDVSYTFTAATPIANILTSSNDITLTSRSTMFIEGQQ